MIEETLRISLTLPIGYVTIGFLCSPTNEKFKWSVKCAGTWCLYVARNLLGDRLSNEYLSRVSMEQHL